MSYCYLGREHFRIKYFYDEKNWEDVINSEFKCFIPNITLGLNLNTRHTTEKIDKIHCWGALLCAIN